VQAAFDDAVKAGQDRDRQKNEGQAYANDVIPRARGTASRLMEEANGYKGRVVANAEGEASRFKQVLVEYNKAPEVTRQRLYLDTVQQVLSSTSKIMIDTKGNGQPALFAARQADAGGRRAGGGRLVGQRPMLPVQAAPNLGPKCRRSRASGTRSRESLRSRERGER
jgi:membrane protease subunit HflK